MQKKLAQLSVDTRARKSETRKSWLGDRLRSVFQWMDRRIELGDWWPSQWLLTSCCNRSRVRVIPRTSKQVRRDFLRANLGSMIESLEPRAMFAVDLGLGDIAFTGYQSTAPDKISFVLLKNVDSGTILSVTDNAWTGTALQSSEGNSVITFGGNFSAGTQFNYDATRASGSRWAVGSSTALLSDTTGSNFALNASGDNLFAYNGSTAPTSGNDTKWVSAFASSSFLTTGSATSSLTYLPSAFTSGTTALTLGLTAGASNQNGALTSPASINGSSSSIRSTVYDVGNWTTFITASGQPVPSTTTFTVTQSGNTNPVIVINSGSSIANGADSVINSSQLLASDAEQSSPSSLTFTLTTLPVHGQLRKSGVAIALNGTFTQADINNNLISYHHFGGTSSSDTFAFSVSDGVGGLLANQTYSLTIAPKVLLSEIKANPPEVQRSAIVISTSNCEAHLVHLWIMCLSSCWMGTISCRIS